MTSVTLTKTEVAELEELLRTASLKEIAERIKFAHVGMSHDKLASLCGIQRPNLIAYEKTRRRPTLRSILRIAEATGRDPRWFVDPEVEMSPFPADEKAA